jgi:hypothetical protein
MTDQYKDQDAELDEEIEEAHDPKNAEQQSIAAADKAADATKTAPKRKGDKSNSQASELKKAATTKAESIEFNGDFSDDLNALVESEATLSDEFKAKTAIIFEAAIKTKLSEEIDRLETEYAEQLAEEVAQTKNELVEKVDSYLNYVVESWMEDNKLAIQSGLRAEIAENFMNKLKDLFAESYVEVPESKVDLVDELATSNEELEEAFNQSVAKNLALTEELEGYKRDAIIREASRDLAETQVEKLKSLAEKIDFEDDETFALKIKTIKESYFSKKTRAVITEESDEADTVEVSGHMAQYINALKRHAKF